MLEALVAFVQPCHTLNYCGINDVFCIEEPSASLLGKRHEGSDRCSSASQLWLSLALGLKRRKFEAQQPIFNTIVVVVSVDVLPEFCNPLLTIVPWHVLLQSLEALAQTISSHA